MKRRYSLKGRNSFREVLQKGRVVRERGVRVIALRRRAERRTNEETRRFGKDIRMAVTLSRTFGKAHERNRAKRRIRAICGELFDELTDGCRFIVKLDRGALGGSYHTEKKSFRSLLIKAGIIRE